MSDRASRLAWLKNETKRRIVILDGVTGTLIQALRLPEEEFRGRRLADHPRSLKGDNAALILTRPDVIRGLHDRYVESGADILKTATFIADPVSQSEFGLQAHSFDMFREGARIAREAADEGEKRHGRPFIVAGCLGPTNKTLSVSPDVGDAAARAIDFDTLAAHYADCARGLAEGGADVLLLETVFDTLNCKAAIAGIEEYFDGAGFRLPFLLSFTAVDKSGRNLSGQTAEAFYVSVAHAAPFAVGINCSLGPRELESFLRDLSRVAPCPVSCHPNAGLPDGLGGFSETPQTMAAALSRFADEGLLNLAGGCCGSGPEHIRAIADALKGKTPRAIPASRRVLSLSGLEPLFKTPEVGFVNVGERTNVAGSKKFARLIREKNYSEALEIAGDQIANGAQIVDVCLDDAMLDARAEMRHFLRLVAGEPDIARVPLMIDSSRWDVIEEGLKNCQGKGIVNSLSLKEGEGEFLRKARIARRLGAAVLVMAFDEKGQADTFERRRAVLERSYRLLVDRAGFAPEDLILDPNVFAVGTGIEAHAAYAVDYIRAVAWVRDCLPFASTSGGVSNVSFSFRGNESLREAVHAVFLRHATAAGLVMGIVNPSQLGSYESLEPELRGRVEDLVLNRRPDATERLLEVAAGLAGQAAGASIVSAADAAWRNASAAERLKTALVKGIVAFVATDVEECLTQYPRALDVIEGPLMDGMKAVGELFGAGRLFLPQVVKSARVMKAAVAVLEPRLAAEKTTASSRGRILLATVKGDVHDIGKNIVGVVLSCAGFEVHDMGVMIGAPEIAAKAKELRADIVGLSGLITPSLEEMAFVAEELDKEGIAVPLLVGGATTSPAHTAIKLAPLYPGPVVQVKDASLATGVVSALLDPASRGGFEAKLREEQARLRRVHEEKSIPLLPLAEARRLRFRADFAAEAPRKPDFVGVRAFPDYPLRELVPLIDWAYFFKAWNMPAKYPAVLDDPRYGAEARKLLADAKDFLERAERGRLIRASGVAGIFPAASTDDDTVLVYEHEDRKRVAATFPFLRQQRRKENTPYSLCLSDFVAPAESAAPDWIGCFAVTTGLGLDGLVRAARKDGDEYRAILAQVLADRLAEAFAERLHLEVRRSLWGYAKDEALSVEDILRMRYQGIRPAPGYPPCPDHTDKRTIFRLLDAERNAGVSLTESCMMSPVSSVSGFYFAHPQAFYFAVGRIDDEQAADYARRKGWTEKDAAKWLAPVMKD